MYVGQAILRREDERFLRGRGLFVEDVTRSTSPSPMRPLSAAPMRMPR